MENYVKRSITLADAERMVQAAMTMAKSLGMAVSVTVVDESGLTKCFVRMDGAPLISIDASRKKAVTAVGMGMATGEPWFEFIKEDPMLREGVHNFNDFLLLGGGIPVSADNQVIGAIGVSGGHYEQDQLCARAAVESIV